MGRAHNSKSATTVNTPTLSFCVILILYSRALVPVRIKHVSYVLPNGNALGASQGGQYANNT